MESSIPKTRKLNNGLECPSMGLGTFNMDSTANVVYESIKAGTRLLDTASIYGNEKEVGEGVNKAIKEGIVKREDMYIITKMCSLDRADPEDALKKSLERLNLSYVDLYFDHWPLFYRTQNGKVIEKNPMHVVWAKMEALVKKGLTKSIGVSNYNVQSLLNLLSFCEIKPAFLEVEYHPYLVQSNLKECCNRNDIRVIAYNSLIKGAYIEFHKEKKIDLLEEHIVKTLAAKYKKTPGQIALNWALSQGMIVIPKTSNPKRMTENLDSMSFKMSEEDIKQMSSLNKHYRYCQSKNWPNTFDDIDYFA